MSKLRAAGVAGCLIMSALAGVGHASGGAVAHVGSQAVDATELDARAAPRIEEERRDEERAQRQAQLRFERNRQAALEEELGKLVDERVLALEAGARKSTTEKLLGAVKIPPVNDQDVRNFYDANRSRITQPLESVQARIKDYLQDQARASAQRRYLDSLRSKYHARIELAPLRETVPLDGPRRGPANAPVTLVEFSDFQCPFCGRYAPVVRQVMEKYPDRVQLIFHHLPLVKIHPNAQKAAEAAVCAQDQGRFWEMHDLMFAEQSKLAVDALKDKARRIGLDTGTFDRCLDEGKATEAVAKDVRDAEQLGIAGTPASFVNGRFLDGAVSAEELGALVEDELRRLPAP